ncbi:DM13 domain-containing protein [Arthrobacter sp. StoSoilB22]|uniref:DM13 domain-containing protein n=1 Tax=Arthrobacter sp. StoSoilB22 TaxID=2830996 RepID=UPI001CC38F29|nr:DM13 domain-containing protein [Arthrobacter sp. StoSoilB22]
MNRLQRMIRAHRILAVVAGVVVLSVVVVAAALFQPWRIFTSSSVYEALPAAPAPASAQAPASASAQAPAIPLPATPEAPVVLGSGTFQSQEHETTGTARLVRLADGSHLLRLEDMASSDGPDVKVWLSSLPAGGDWFKYRSGRYVDLGAVKATHGNHNYLLPPGTDITGLTSVVLWCDRFSVAFGSAPLI